MEVIVLMFIVVGTIVTISLWRDEPWNAPIYARDPETGEWTEC